MIILVCALLLAPAWASDGQFVNVKSVKGGYRGGHQYNPGANLQNFYGNSSQTQYGGYGRQNITSDSHSTYNVSQHVKFEVGVCYIEVPTASLAKNPGHIPVGNGSRSDLSRIRSCCKGYIRNIHNYYICDPVCSNECVNALCSAPETCTCFPDHVKNLAGICIPTCPIGCQNGHCSGGECLCKDGYKLDSDGKYCIPYCRESCGGLGNCTAPNTCECKKDYQSTPQGNCKPSCQGCANGDCIAPNDCRCKQGYSKDQKGECIPQCPQGCAPNGRCVAPNVCDTPQGQKPIVSPSFNPTYQQNNPLLPGSLVTQSPLNNMNHTYPSSPKYPGQYGIPAYPGQFNRINDQIYPGQPGYGRPIYSNVYPNQGDLRYPNYPYPDQQNPQNATYLGQSNYPNAYVPVSSNSGQPSHGNSIYPALPTGSNSTNPGLGNATYPHQSNSNSPGQLGPNNSTYSRQPGTGYPYPNQYGSHGQTEHREQQGQSDYYGQSGYRGQNEYHGQSGYGGQSEYRGQSDYNQQSGFNSQSAYNSQSEYNKESGSHHQEGHRDVEAYYPGSQMYPDTQQLANIDNIYQCSEECVNGICVEGNRCQCNPGYIQDRNDPTGSKCVPNCPGGCPNGVCSAPNFCICNAGYYKDRSVKGRPACVKRIRRSTDKRPINVAEVLIFDIPDDE